jgi:putative transposase
MLWFYTMPQGSSSIFSPALDLATIPETIWEEARHREALIRPLAEQPINPQDQVEAAARALDLSARHVYTLIQRYRISGGLLTSLMPGKTSGGRGKSRLSGDQDAIIREAIEAVYLNRQRAPVSRVIEDVHRRCHRAGINPPSAGAVRRRVQALSVQETVCQRYGGKALRSQTAPVTGAFPDSLYPMAVIQIDHTPVDLIIVDDSEREPIGRPYLTVAIDVYSRCITGFCLTLDPPSAVSVGLCLTHAVLDKAEWLAARGIEGDWPLQGKPEWLHVDNAAEFHSDALRRGCEQHGLGLDYRPVGQPHYGGIVERVIGTLMQLVHDLPGTTFSNVAERGDYPSEGRAALTLAELEHWLGVAIVNYYHQKPHASLKVPPLIRYREGVQRRSDELGQPYPPPLGNPQAFIIDFLPVVWRTVQRHGFMIDHIAYYSDALRPWIGDPNLGKFLIRRDPRDLSRVYVLDPQSQQYLEVPYRRLARPSITLWEHRQALKRLRAQGALHTDESAIFRAIEEMRAIAETAVTTSRRTRRLNQRRRQAPTTPAKLDQETATPTRKNPKPKRFDDIEPW